MWHAECQKNQNYQISTVTISKFQGGKRKAWRVHVFRTTDLKLHTNLDWTSQKLAENSVGLHRSSREKTLSSYEHRRKNGVKGGKMGKSGKKKVFFLFKPTTLSTGSLVDAITLHIWLSILLPSWCICKENLKRGMSYNSQCVSASGIIVYLPLEGVKHMPVSHVWAKLV